MDLRCAILPDDSVPGLRETVRRAGGKVVDPGEAEALIWSVPDRADELRRVLTQHEGIAWVQLPFAGIEPLLDVLDNDHIWTCGKGAYAEPVAELALALALAGVRHVGGYARRSGWSPPQGRNLIGGRATILGGGAITRALVRLLVPFNLHLTVVRNHPEPVPDVTRVVTTDALHDCLAESDLVVLALALTPATEGIIDQAALEAMLPHAWLVNVARGRHVDTPALVESLSRRVIGGAALDVTDPEPLADEHPLWGLDNCIITPHVGSIPEVTVRLLNERVGDNIRRYIAGQDLLGQIDIELGY